MAPKIPKISWYQREKTVHITLSVNTKSVSDLLLEVRNNSSLILDYPKTDPTYHIELNTCKEIDSEISTQSISEREIKFVLHKKNAEQWDRLTKNKNEYSNHIQVDWSNWIDDSDEDESNPQNLDFASMMQNMDPKMMQQLSQMQAGQEPNLEDIDSNDENEEQQKDEIDGNSEEVDTDNTNSVPGQ